MITYPISTARSDASVSHVFSNETTEIVLKTLTIAPLFDSSVKLLSVSCDYTITAGSGGNHALQFKIVSDNLVDFYSGGVVYLSENQAGAYHASVIASDVILDPAVPLIISVKSVGNGYNPTISVSNFAVTYTFQRASGIDVTFCGQNIGAWQKGDPTYTEDSQSTALLTGLVFDSVPPVSQDPDPTFDCYTEDYSEISSLLKLRSTYGTLVVDGVTVNDCRISSISKIHEVKRGSGKYTYSIIFKVVQVY